jgi:hypothetical protein
MAGTIIYREDVGRFARTVRPGESLDLVCGIPPLPAGSYLLIADLLDAEAIELLNTAFVQHGSEPLEANLVVG